MNIMKMKKPKMKHKVVVISSWETMRTINFEAPVLTAFRLRRYGKVEHSGNTNTHEYNLYVSHRYSFSEVLKYVNKL